MTVNDFEQEVPVSGYGAARRAAWLAHHQANSDMAGRAVLEAHGRSEDHRVVQAGQQGLFPGMSPTDMGAEVAARSATVGADFAGQSRVIPRLGGTFTHANEGPAPARIDMTRLNDRPGFRRADQNRE